MILILYPVSVISVHSPILLGLKRFILLYLLLLLFVVPYLYIYILFSILLGELSSLP